MKLTLLPFIAVVVAVLFAASIGASGTAAAMGAAYGGGAVKSRRVAVWLAGICAAIGAVTSGSAVAVTISQGLIPSSLITAEVSVIILTAACLALYYANHLGIPLSTSEVTIGSLVGAGLAFSQVYWHTFAIIVFAWLVTPVLAFLISYALNRLLAPLDKRWSAQQGMWRYLLVMILTLCGCYEAFSAGMNNAANAIGPLIGAEIVPLPLGLCIAALAMAGGSITLGSKVLETNGKKIVTLSLLQGSVVSFTGGSLIMSASLLGLPVPLTQATTMAIIAAGGQKMGLSIFRQPVVKRIMMIWILSPVSSMVLSYLLVKMIVFGSNLYIVLTCAFILILMTVLYVKNMTNPFPFRKERNVRP